MLAHERSLFPVLVSHPRSILTASDWLGEEPAPEARYLENLSTGESIRAVPLRAAWEDNTRFSFPRSRHPATARCSPPARSCQAGRFRSRAATLHCGSGRAFPGGKSSESRGLRRHAFSPTAGSSRPTTAAPG